MKLSNRCTVLRDRIVNEKPLNEKILPQHIMLFEAGIWNALQTGCSRPHSRIAAGMENVILNAPIIIQDLELLVGYNYADTPYPEFWSPTDTEEDKQIVLNAGFTLEQYRAHLQHHDEVLKYWQYDRHSCGYAQNHADITAEGPFDFIRDFTTADLELDDEWAAIGRCMSDNHTIIGYEKVLRKGFLGLLEEVEQAEKQHGPSDFYDALKALCRAAATLGARYAAQARELAKDYEPGSERYDELLRIAAVCDRVPAQPARSFHEAVQSLVFAHIINTWEDGINANSLGRLDQILYPYYVNDITNKKLSDEQAFELICSLWLKLYRDYDVQQSCVGGCDRNGKDATNALSYMMLDATEALGFIRCLSVRYHSGTDKAFLKRALEVVGRVQKGVPFFFNDEVMIPALVSKGIALEDAREYTQIGCVETVLSLGSCFYYLLDRTK